MVRNYKRKTNRSAIDEEKVKRAISDIRTKLETPTSAAEKYGINRTTLIMRMKKQDPFKVWSDSGNESSSDKGFTFQSKYTPRQTLTKIQEKELVEYVKKSSFHAYGLSNDSFQKFVYDFTKTNNISCPPSWEISKRAGEDWLYGFLKRNPELSLRKPEKMSLARLKGFTKSAVENFFQDLRQIYAQYSFDPKDIYNLDETGITTVMNSIKVLAAKGQRAVAQAVSAERGCLVTMVGIVNACGNRLPPAYVFPCISLNERISNGCFPGSLILNSKSGRMISELFVNLLKHVQNFTNCSKERPILIVLDNHASHCSLPSIDFCRDNGIILLSFPPHTSHRLQPLDVSVFGPFKRFCKKAFSDFLSTNHGKQITMYDVAKLTNLPFQMAFSSRNILNAFQVTGINPYNSQIFRDDEFVVDTLPDEDNLVESVPATQSNTNTPSNIATTAKSPIPSLTTESVRPIARFSTPNRSARSGCLRILTSSTKKRRVQENKDKINAKPAKRKLKLLDESEKKTNTKCFKKAHRLELDSSDESDKGISYAESDKSNGIILDQENFEMKRTELFEYKLTNDEILEVGHYVLVKFGEHSKKPFYYAGEISEVHSDSAYIVNYLRKASLIGWLFTKPAVEDISFTLRSEIKFKLPQPTNPASTSRCRQKYLFDVDFGKLYIK